jgi:hypothetical protein
VYLSGAQIEIDAIERHDTGESLAYTLELQDFPRGRHIGRTARPPLCGRFCQSRLQYVQDFTVRPVESQASGQSNLGRLKRTNGCLVKPM